MSFFESVLFSKPSTIPTGVARLVGQPWGDIHTCANCGRACDTSEMHIKKNGVTGSTCARCTQKRALKRLGNVVPDLASAGVWFSVDDHTPTRGEVVLTLSEKGRLTVRRFCANKFTDSPDNVSLWMRIPKQPVKCA